MGRGVQPPWFVVAAVASCPAVRFPLSPSGYAFGVVDLSATPGSPALPGITDLVPIGRGGSATVYRGWQGALHRQVAVKVLDGGPGTPNLERFGKEVRALGSLSGHPHVVAIYDAGEVDGRPYLVMPYMRGGSLEERVQQGPLPAEDVVRLGIAIADALTSAHRLGVVHRDIKPANILATDYGEPQLADFGIARWVDSTLTQTELTATVGYAAPEVLAGQPASPASDVYSLGATLFTSLRGAPAFVACDGEPVVSFALRVMEGTPADLVAEGHDPALAAVVDRAMAKDPAARFASAADLRAALEALHLGSAPSPVHSGAPGEDGGATVRAGAVAAARGGAPPDPDARDGRDPGPPSIEPLPPRPVAAGGRQPDRAPRRLLVGVAAALALLVAALAGLLATRPHHAGGALGAAHAATPTTRPAPTTVPSRPATAPTTGPAPPPTTAVAPTTTAPSSSGSAANTAARGGTPAGLADTVNRYYAMVSAHQLSQSFAWLSPAFQQRIGYAYYQQFWDGFSQVQVVQVTPGTTTAAITLKYTQTNGTVQTENATLGFITDSATGKLLIDTDRVT